MKWGQALSAISEILESGSLIVFLKLKPTDWPLLAPKVRLLSQPDNESCRQGIATYS